MGYRTILIIAGLALSTVSAQAQDNQQASQGASGNVNVYKYALEHPMQDTDVSFLPILGESVPKQVQLEQPQGNETYGYFYYAGQPVIVDLATRSVVRID
ncbi:DUF1236 domain-containing protein [Consotaella aegiceratis]|uniref:DUF1236 domain-containing protein n=1 Tax=Consotaella aegiceratis TaxID=3097961 RepID=UPI002F3E6702